MITIAFYPPSTAVMCGRYNMIGLELGLVVVQNKSKINVCTLERHKFYVSNLRHLHTDNLQCDLITVRVRF